MGDDVMTLALRVATEIRCLADARWEYLEAFRDGRVERDRRQELADDVAAAENNVADALVALVGGSK